MVALGMNAAIRFVAETHLLAPIKLSSFTRKKKKKTEFSANANLNNNKKNCGWMQCESVK